MSIKGFPLLCLVLASTTLAAQTSSEQATAAYLQKIKEQPQSLQVFLQNMPKGGDLHNHVSGASMAENSIRYAKGDGLCVDRQTFTVSQNAQCTSDNLLDNSAKSAELYNGIIDAWSMRNWTSMKDSSHDHFFNAFGKYSAISSMHFADMLAEVVDRAGQQNESYLELMTTPQLAADLGNSVGWDNDFARLRKKLLAAGIVNLAEKSMEGMQMYEAKARQILACDTASASKGCQVKVRYLFQVLREKQPVEVFAQLLTAFETVSRDHNKQFVGINLVQPEDGYLSMRDYKLQMQMVGFLRKLYPNVHVSLHAGELISSLVSPDGLRFHIHDAVTVAQADRIGHGVDVAYEDNADRLLRTMAEKNVMVEINLSSNAAILGIEGNNHPFELYRQYHVPLAISTDDEGILRTNLTEQYQRAILTYQLDYMSVKNLVRNSMTYSFLPGESLWQDRDYKRMNAACARDSLNAKAVSNACKTLLGKSEKAQLQWELEKQFSVFENGYVRSPVIPARL